jgi:hypothetical protein
MHVNWLFKIQDHISREDVDGKLRPNKMIRVCLVPGMATPLGKRNSFY